MLQEEEAEQNARLAEAETKVKAVAKQKADAEAVVAAAAEAERKRVEEAKRISEAATPCAQRRRGNQRRVKSQVKSQRLGSWM